MDRLSLSLFLFLSVELLCHCTFSICERRTEWSAMLTLISSENPWASSCLYSFASYGMLGCPGVRWWWWCCCHVPLWPSIAIGGAPNEDAFVRYGIEIVNHKRELAWAASDTDPLLFPSSSSPRFPCLVHESSLAALAMSRFLNVGLVTE